MEQLARPHAQGLIRALRAAGSPDVHRWLALEERVKQAATESKECVRYLYALDRYTASLYGKVCREALVRQM